MLSGCLGSPLVGCVTKLRRIARSLRRDTVVGSAEFVFEPGVVLAAIIGIRAIVPCWTVWITEMVSFALVFVLGFVPSDPCSMWPTKVAFPTRTLANGFPG